MRKSKVTCINILVVFLLFGISTISKVVSAGTVESEVQLTYEGEEKTPLEIIQDIIQDVPTNSGSGIKKMLQGKLPQTNEVFSLVGMFIGLLLIVGFFVVLIKRRRRTTTHE